MTVYPVYVKYKKEGSNTHRGKCIKKCFSYEEALNIAERYIWRFIEKEERLTNRCVFTSIKIKRDHTWQYNYYISATEHEFEIDSYDWDGPSGNGITFCVSLYPREDTIEFKNWFSPDKGEFPPEEGNYLASINKDGVLLTKEVHYDGTHFYDLTGKEMGTNLYAWTMMPEACWVESK